MQPGTYRIIPVKAKTHTVFALVSPEDYEALARHRWCLSSAGYAIRNLPRNGSHGPRIQMQMHRAVMGMERGDGRECDHINRDKLDNRRANLRDVTHAENCLNVSSQAGSSSRFRGVTWQKREGMWQTRAGFKGRTYCLGYYRDEREAARVVNEFWVARGVPAPNDLRAVA